MLLSAARLLKPLAPGYMAAGRQRSTDIGRVCYVRYLEVGAKGLAECDLSLRTAGGSRYVGTSQKRVWRVFKANSVSNIAYQSMPSLSKCNTPKKRCCSHLFFGVLHDYIRYCLGLGLVEVS
jgi:hypothetical protein